MNILGITITRTKNATPEEEESLVQTFDSEGRPVTQAKIFSMRYAKGSARETLLDIANNAKAANSVTKLVMAITMPHQIGYILKIAPFDWNGVFNIAASITLLLMAFLGPLAIDWATLVCIRIVASKTMSTRSKKWTAILMMLPVGFSGFINFIAPAPLVMKVMAAFLVSLIPVTQIVRAIGNNPDFRQIDKEEREITDFANEPAPSITDEERARRAERARKAAETRAANKLAKEKAEEISEEEREARRERGLRAAETRRLRAVAEAQAAAAQAQADARKARRGSKTTKTPAQEIEELEDNPAPVSPAMV